MNSYKTALLKEREEIEKSLALAEDSTKPVELDQTTQGRVSRIDAIQQQEMVLAAQRRREQRLSMIDSALKRIESGDFGYCIICDEAIPEKRLELDPATLKCVMCANS